MIEIKGLSKSFGSQKVLDRLDLSVSKSDRVVLLGQNGAGKTTLMRCILGEYNPDEGEVQINGVSPFKDRLRAIADIAFVPQIPPPLKLSVEGLIDYAVGLSGFDKAKVGEYMDCMQFALEPQLKKTFYKLSGGMKQKVLISIALARDTSTLIFDEPTANLDIEGRRRFIELLQVHGAHKNIIFISHRLEDIAELVNRKIVMDMGRITEDEKI